MRGERLTRIEWRLAIAVAAFNALSAVGGGAAGLLSDGLGAPKSILDATPFRSFLFPELILLAVVGGTQATAAVQLIRRAPSSLFWNAFASFGMIIWIMTEVMMILGTSWLQVVYFGTGVLQLALTFGLLGILPWLPGPGLVRERTSARPPAV